MLRRGCYDVLVDGNLAGFLRVTDVLLWFLGPPWRGERPKGFSVKRTGPAGTVATWKGAVAGGPVPFGRGNIAVRKGGFPSEARSSEGGLLALDFSADDAYAFLQLDPGVVGIWQGANAMVLRDPDLGFGYAEGSIQVHTEVFVPLDGAVEVTALTVRQLEAADNSSLVVRAFKRLTKSHHLDYARGAEWQLSEYARAPQFWSAAAQHG